MSLVCAEFQIASMRAVRLMNPLELNGTDLERKLPKICRHNTMFLFAIIFLLKSFFLKGKPAQVPTTLTIGKNNKLQAKFRQSQANEVHSKKHPSINTAVKQHCNDVNKKSVNVLYSVTYTFIDI